MTANQQKFLRDVLIIAFLIFLIWLFFKMLGFFFRSIWVVLLAVIVVYVLIRLGVFKISMK